MEFLMDKKTLRCPITGIESKYLGMTKNNAYVYQNSVVGKVEVTIYAYEMIEDLTESKKKIIAGYCRNGNYSHDMVLITTDIVKSIDQLDFPKGFKQQKNHLLKRIFQSGNGDERQSKDYDCNKDFPIAYCDSPERMNRLMEALLNSDLIECVNPHSAFDNELYLEVCVTDQAEEQILFNPDIYLTTELKRFISFTGIAKIDERIQAALDQFAKHNIEAKKAACSILASVLEPIREDCKKYLDSKSVEDFFNIVNNFDIRHNKKTTKELIHPEQVEWVFYSLLNTINTYYKLSARLD